MASTRSKIVFLLKELLEEAEDLLKVDYVNKKSEQLEEFQDDIRDEMLIKKLNLLSQERDQKLESEIIDNLIYYIRNEGLHQILPCTFSYGINQQSAKYLLDNPYELLSILYLKPTLISESDFNGNTLLHYLAKNYYHENMKIVLDILFNNTKIFVNPCLQNKNGNTVLHLFLMHAIEKGSFDSNMEKIEGYEAQKRWGLSYEQLMFLYKIMGKKFDYSIKNHRGISCKQLNLIYNLKYLFQLEELESCLKKDDSDLMTKDLFKDPQLNPIHVLRDYKQVVANGKKNEKDSGRIIKYDQLIQKLDKIIINLNSLKDDLFKLGPSFFSKSCTLKEEKLHHVNSLKIG